MNLENLKCVPYIFKSLWNKDIENRIYTTKEVLELLKKHYISISMYHDFSFNYLYDSDLDFVKTKVYELLNVPKKEFLIFTLENEGVMHLTRIYNKNHIIDNIEKYKVLKNYKNANVYLVIEL
jgi:hypothetical protein